MRRRALLAAIPAGLLLPVAARADEGALAVAVEAGAQGYLKATPQAVGLSIGVFRGKAEHRAHFGSVERGAGRKPDARTIYPIASISKTMTGVLLAQASLEGRVGLDDDIRSHIEGDYPNLAFDGQPIRLWHLLNHNSGLPFRLPDIPETRPPFPEPSPEVAKTIAAYSRADFYRDLHAVKLDRMPGTGFSYSNAAATLLSHVLERAFGGPFDALVRKRIAAPIGARDTMIAPDAGQRARLARGYDEKGREAPPPEESMLGAAAVKSTVDDLLAYARWHVEEASEAIRLSHRPHPIQGKFAVGLNWQMMIDGPRRRIWQDGTTPGFVSMCALLPHAGAGLVAFANELDRDSMSSFQNMTRQILLALDPGSADLF